MKHYGDITKIKGAAVEPVDVVCGGSPCQDLSVAGKRAGLAGERSGLFMEQIRLIKEMRKYVDELHSRGANVDIRPVRYMVWENVCGAYSSNGGEDFRAVLEETCRVVDEDAVIPGPPNGKWSYAGLIVGEVDGQPYSVAWRTHDAQYWGVAQRRRRISLVADFGGDTAGEILFECESVPGNPGSCGTTGETAAADAQGGIGEAISFQERAGKPGGGKGILIQNEHTGALNQQCGQSVCSAIGFNRERGVATMEDGMPTIQAAAGESGNNKPMVCYPISTMNATRGGEESRTSFGVGEQDKPQFTITTNHTNAVCMETFHCSSSEEVSGVLRARDYKDPQIVCLNDQGGQQMDVSDGVTGTLRAQEHGHQPVVFGISPYESNAMKSDNPTSGIYEADTARTLDLNGGSPACNQGGMAVVQGADVYNGQLTGDVAATLNAASGSSGTHSGPSIVETYRKTAHPMNAEDGQGWEESKVNDTLNCHDNSETRTPTLVVGVDTYNLATTGDVGRTLTAANGGINEHAPVVLENHPADSRVKVCEDNVFQTLSSRMGTGGGNVPMVMEQQKTVGALMASGYSKNGTQEAQNGMYIVQESWDGTQVAPTLTANNANGNQRMPDKDNFNAVISYGLDRASYNQGKNAKFDFSVDEEKVGPQLDMGPGAVACAGVDFRNVAEYQDLNGTIQSKKDGGYNNNSNTVARVGSVVRRLTPKECERLQGFPDDWTSIGEWVDSKGKKHKEADSCRYRALGNSIALPFWKWMAKRMAEHLPNDATMASLFDGIGGFPLSFSEAGVKPVWASEIEEFPIAVTKLRFPE